MQGPEQRPDTKRRPGTGQQAAAAPAAKPAEGTRHWPYEILHKTDEKVLIIGFNDRSRFTLPAEFLQVESPSAEVRGHGGREAKSIVAGRRNVAITDIEHVGSYAIRLIFDDGHDSGIYSWDTLYELGRNQEKLWSDYLTALERNGQSRDA